MEDSEGPRWRWTLANGARVVAELSSDGRVEYVRLGDRTVSECARGEKPDGHVIDAPPRDEEGESLRASITFDPKSTICVLRVDDHEVAPIEWPKPRPPRKLEPVQTPARVPIVAIVVLGTLAMIGLVFAVRSCARDKPEKPSTIATYRAPSGLFVAHPPSDMKLSAIALPLPMTGVLGTTETTAIVIAAGRLDASSAHEPWVLSKQYLPEVLPLLPRGGGKLVESDRRDDTCLGERGAVVSGTLTSPTGMRSKLWSCTFVRDDAGYLVVDVHVEPMTIADERRLRTIVDATELTNLAEIVPAPSAN
jgi:hypothetical protein